MMRSDPNPLSKYGCLRWYLTMGMVPMGYKDLRFGLISEQLLGGVLSLSEITLNISSHFGF